MPGLASETSPLKLEIEPVKRIYSNREGLMVKFILTARERTKVCLSKDILSRMRIEVHRSGTGKLPLQPLVVQDNSVRFQERLKIRWLDPGESLTFRTNLKRFSFAGDERWEPGEYNVSASFGLCPQDSSEYVTLTDPETPIHTTTSGWFMIMI